MVLAFFVGQGEIGIFAAASSLVTRILLVPNAVEKALLPRVSADDSGRPELVAQVARLSGAIAGVALGVLIALSEPLVRLVLSPRFLPALPLIWIIAPGTLIRASSKALVSYFMGTDRPSICSWSVGAGTLVNVLVLAVLLPPMGLMGAAIAMTAGYLTSGLILVFAFRSASGLSLRDAWAPRASDLTLLLGAARTVWRPRGSDRRAGPHSRGEP